MDLKNEEWVVEEQITKKEMEVLFLLLETAEFKIWHGIRNYSVTDTYPHVYYKPRNELVHGCRKVPEEPGFVYNTVRRVPYLTIIEELKILIKSQIEHNEKVKEQLG
jgi:hypothetical protein